MTSMDNHLKKDVTIHHKMRACHFTRCIYIILIEYLSILTLVHGTLFGDIGGVTMFRHWGLKSTTCNPHLVMNISNSQCQFGVNRRIPLTFFPLWNRNPSFHRESGVQVKQLINYPVCFHSAFKQRLFSTPIDLKYLSTTGTCDGDSIDDKLIQMSLTKTIEDQSNDKPDFLQISDEYKINIISSQTQNQSLSNLSSQVDVESIIPLNLQNLLLHHSLNKTESNVNATMIHSFNYPHENLKLYGVGVSFKKFKSFVLYKLSELQETSLGKQDLDPLITSYKIPTNSNETRTILRQEWFSRRLICDRTEVLTIYPSDRDHLPADQKRGGFQDLIQIYTDRLVHIIQDEQSTINHNATFSIITWLQDELGYQKANQLSFAEFAKLTSKKQIVTMQEFMNWFRDKFPYYYDKCDACGASFRDDEKNQVKITEEMESSKISDDINTTSPTHICSTNNNRNSDKIGSEQNQQHSSHEKEDKGSFLGYIYPSTDELIGEASRTELYQCHRCQHYTRFPRFNSIQQIVQTKRGRCGEYSILLYRILRALGHEARWVVDWSDHVWAECNIGGRFVHLDPCEAAVDQPLLYKNWGKKQTFILAFRAPSFMEMSLGGEKDNAISTKPKSSRRSLCVEDVTHNYTTDAKSVIRKRREESDSSIQSSLLQAEERLQEAFQQMIFHDTNVS